MNYNKTPSDSEKMRAGEQNRTVVASLEGWCFTTKLHPHVGHAGFEPATPGSQNQYASQTALMTEHGKSKHFYQNRAGILSNRLNLVNDRNSVSQQGIQKDPLLALHAVHFQLGTHRAKK